MPKRPQDLEAQFAALNLLEEELWARGYTHVAGLDEAGRGPLAGPVVAAAVILDPKRPILGLNDSKKLSARKREELFTQIKEQAISYEIAYCDQDTIDEINILQATKECMTQAVSQMSTQPDYLLIDALRLALPLPQEAIVKGDSRANCIAAASVLAKVSRDQAMEGFAEIYPQYGFAKNKGYGTREHIAALKEYGPCPLHRLSFLHKLQLGHARRESRSTAVGQGAETVVALDLQRRGYRLLIQNFQLQPVGEVDLIAENEERYLIVEVKARQEKDVRTSDFWGLDKSKVERIRRLGEYFLNSRGHDKKVISSVAALCTLDSRGQVLQIKFISLD